MLNMELDAEVLKLFIIELSVVVCDDDPRKAKSRDDGLSYEFFGLGLSDLSHWLGFFPFGEIVYGYE